MRKVQHTSATHCDEFCHDGDSDLLRRDGADVEAYRGEHALETFSCNPLRFQLLIDGKNLAARSNHSNVERGSIDSPAEDLHVVTVAAGDNDNVRTFAGG